MDHHTAAVARIASQVKSLYEQKKPFKIYHGTTNSTRKIVVDRSSVLDINSLSHVLDLNVSTMTALVEPNVSMTHLASLTLPYGLLPAVVPEFPAITLGGAVAGTAGESSSFKYGFVSENVNWMELVLANGQITKASADDNPELFDGVAGTFGSVAIMTLLEIRLVKAKDHVNLTHTPVNSVRELLWRIKKETENEAIDFVDAIMYKRNRGVVITGRFAEVIPTSKQVQRYARAKDEWYYLHIRNILDKASSTWTETVPTADYLFRYDRDAFWAGRYVFTYFGIPFIRLFRWALDPFFHTKVLYHGLHENGMAKHNIIQDIILPASRTQDFIYWVDQEFGIYPLWLCPFCRRRRPGGTSQQLGLHPRSSSLLLHKEEEKEGSTEPPLLISIGLWGPRLPDPQDFVAENRKIEGKVQELGGVKWLYAQCHYTEEEFWTVYDREWYEELRRKYSAEYLPSVYDKTKFDWDAEERAIRGNWLRWLFSFVWWIWPLPGVYGVIRVLMRSEYLLAT